MVQHYYRNVHAVLFVYDVTCPASFGSLRSWVEECRQNSLGHEVPRSPPPVLSQDASRSAGSLTSVCIFSGSSWGTRATCATPAAPAAR